MLLLIACICVSFDGFNFALAQKTYNGYKVYNVSIDTDQKLHFIQSFEDTDGYDFWLRPYPFGHFHIMVTPELQPGFEQELKSKSVEFEVLHDDVGLLLEKNTTVHSSKRKVRSVSHEEKAAAEFNFQYFPRYDEIVKFMENLVLNRYAKLINIGSSAEGRPIYGIEVSKYANNPVFLIDAGTHAREWASHVSALYIIQQVIENEEEFANRLNLVIIPCLNPDGYEYTHTTNRFWRKSRSQQSNRMCPGVDLNRNFDSHFGEFRSDTSNVCSRLFAGKRAFSEPESAALRDTILAYKPIAYLSIHSFGGYLLYPYGYTKILPQNWQTLDRIAKLVVERAKEFSGTEYKYGSAARLLYKASGASDDWAMDKGNVSLVFTIELPAYSDRAFIVPENKIMTLVQETFETFLAMFNEIFNYTKSYTFSRT